LREGRSPLTGIALLDRVGDLGHIELVWRRGHEECLADERGVGHGWARSGELSESEDGLVLLDCGLGHRVRVVRLVAVVRHITVGFVLGLESRG
jgi:hypothetical protein